MKSLLSKIASFNGTRLVRTAVGSKLGSRIKQRASTNFTSWFFSHKFLLNLSRGNQNFGSSFEFSQFFCSFDFLRLFSSKIFSCEWWMILFIRDISLYIVSGKLVISRHPKSQFSRPWHLQLKNKKLYLEIFSKLFAALRLSEAIQADL